MKIINYQLSIINVVMLLFFNICSASIIESISISTIKDTTLLVFEVDTNVKITTNRVSNAKLQLIFNANTGVKNVNTKGIIKKIAISSELNNTIFDLTFNKPYDFRRANETSTIMYKFYSIPTREIKTIVLDPGHGGVDPGAVGKKKLQEKEVNLAIAKSLKKKLEDYGLRVLITRNDDRFVSLAERTRFANDKKADLFISIHCNASATNRKASGFETYYLSEAKTDMERAALARENDALKYEPAVADDIIRDELSLILADLTQNEFLKESYNLALAVQTSAVNVLTDVDRGVKQAGFYVLRGCFMPSILVECGFLSNATEEKQLSRSVYREKAAKTIFLGIVSYIKDYEKRIEF